MKIAIATDDFINVTGHVGRCKGFLIFDVENGKILKEERIENNFTNHSRGISKEVGKVHGHNHGEQNGSSGHGRLSEGLKGCSHLICHGAGWRLVDDLKAQNIELVLTHEKDAKTTALKFENKELEIDENMVCHSH